MTGDNVRCPLCGELTTDERPTEDLSQTAYQSACRTCLELLFSTDLQKWTGQALAA
jgi:hypothetical protein